MRIRKATILLILFTLLMVVTSVATLHSSNHDIPPVRLRQGESRYGRIEFEKRFPTVHFEKPEPSDFEERTRRRIKNGRYDKFGFAIKDPSPSIGEETFENEWSLQTEALPAKRSSAVVVGEVIAAEAHLSNDKSGVYSEFTVRVNEVLKSAGSEQLQPSALITIDRAGGFVSYANRHKRLYRIAGQNMPLVGQRYLFFLDAPDESPNHHIITGYELGAGGVSPLDESRRMNIYKGMDEAAFLKAVLNAIAQAPQMNS